MCGFLLQYSEQALDNECFRKALLRMEHRGPDSQRVYHLGNVFLGSVRLSITDPRSSSDMPFISSCKQVGLVFNGQIYNHNELRRKYKAEGYSFRTKCDTEVILAGYLMNGRSSFAALDGMYAFSIYDTREGEKILLSRDYSGQKPLYYANTHGKLYAGSTLDSIVSLMGHGLVPDLSSLNYYLALGYTRIGHTLDSRIKEVLPGETITFSLDCNRLENTYSSTLTEVRHSKTCELERVLTDSLISIIPRDVSYALSLSGGIDSTLILALLKKLDIRPTAYTVTYPGIGHYDESEYAKKSAKRYGAEFVEVPLLVSDFLEHVEAYYARIPHPVGDLSVIPTSYLSRKTVGNAKVLIGGDGADEIFGGYSSYQRHLNPAPLSMGRIALSSLLQKLPVSFKGRNRVLDAIANNIDLYNSRSILMTKRLRESVLGYKSQSIFDYPELYRSRFFEDNLSNLSNVMKSDFRSYLPSNILAKTDTCSMLFSQEVRTPYLNREVVSYADGLNDSDLLAKGSTKIILRKLLGNLGCPSEILGKPKTGFSLPTHYLGDPSFISLAQANLNHALVYFDSSSSLRKRLTLRPTSSIQDIAYSFHLSSLGAWLKSLER